MTLGLALTLLGITLLAAGCIWYDAADRDRAADNRARAGRLRRELDRQP